MTKTIRKEAFMVDIILNYNKSQVQDFAQLLSRTEQLVSQALNRHEVEYLVQAQTSQDQAAQILVLHVNDDGTKLSARFFLQSITYVDTYYSIKHWFLMQKSLSLYAQDSIQQAKYSTVLRLLKQWRTMKQLGSTIYPEVIDSVLLMLLNKLAKKNEDFFLNNSISLVVVRVLEELA